MRKKLSFIVVLAVAAGLTACHHDNLALKEADAFYREGLEQQANKNTEAAAASFSNALLAINQCDTSLTEVKRLKAQTEDNLGAIYWKHGLNDEAMELHLDAITLSRELHDTSLLMKALHNCGRVTASLQRIQDAQIFYDESLHLAKNRNDSTFVNKLLMETSHDLHLESGHYPQAITNATQALSNGADPGFCHLVIGLAHYYLQEDSLAFTHLQQASKSEKPGTRMSAYQGLCQLHQYAGDYQKALECHQLFTENMMLADQQSRREEVERIKADYDLQLQKQILQAKQKQKSLRLYLILGALLVFLIILLLLLRQKTMSARLKDEAMKYEIEQALKKNKVHVTALALTEQITASSLDFILDESDWEEYMALVDKRYGDFTKKLLAKYPNLTKGDVQICCLTKQGFSNQVIAILMNQQTASYARRKSRIKQEKMNGLEDERSFEDIIHSL